ncbi:ankyrin repeat protein [Apiospora saccharicola]|uniref:Ankyrin repeat protein n=1 Tax=Apiospora saccharicola TaxID=335842 RepID=A0ABR1V9G2_9PEZI
MEGLTRREKDQVWESLRADVERMFIRERLGLNGIISCLAEKGIHVTKNELNYRLNKIWRLRIRAPRGQATQLWRVAGRAQESKLEQEKDQSGRIIGSIILPNHQRLKAGDPTRQIRRYNTETHHVASTLQNDAQLQVSIRSPTPERVMMFIPWPKDLPWLVSGIQRLKIETDSSADTQPPQNTSSTRLISLLGMPDGILATNERLKHLFISKLASQIPEAEHGDASRRAQLVLSDRSEKALSEQVKLLLGRISNNLLEKPKFEKGQDEYEFLLGLIERSGLSKTPLDIQDHDYTTKAASDVLFQSTFGFLINIKFARVQIQYDATRACRVLIWLLKSRQDPNTPIPVYFVGRTTGLQISLALGLSDLAVAFLDHGANPGGFKIYTFSPEYIAEEIFNLHPIFLSFITCQQTVTARLESVGGSLLDEVELPPFNFGLHKSLFMRKGWYRGHDLSGLGKVTPLVFIFRQLRTPCTASIVQYLFEYTDLNGSPVYRGLIDWREILIYAAFAGDLSSLRFLLSRQSDILGLRYSTPADFVNWSNKWGITPLHAAVVAKQNSVEACELLCHHGAIISHSELIHLTCYFGTVDTVKYLHQRGATLDKRPSRCSPFWRSLSLPQLNPLHHTPLEFMFQKSEDWREDYSFEDGAATCAYLIREGADVPLELVDFAIRTCNTQMISLAFDSAMGIVNRYQQTYGSPLSKVLMPLHSLYRPNILMDEQKSDRLLIYHRLLDEGAWVGAGHATMAAYHGDWALVEKILTADTGGVSKTFPYTPNKTMFFSFRPSDYPIEISLLETAILSGSQVMARKAFGLDPNQYSAGALCAATVMETIHGDLTIIDSLLKNRSRLELQVSKQQRYMEMSAIGIAAFGGRLELLQILERALPWSDEAIVPGSFELREIFMEDSTDRKRSRGPIGAGNWTGNQPAFIRFWSEGRIGSIQMFAIKTEARIFDLFFNNSSTIDPDFLCMILELVFLTEISPQYAESPLKVAAEHGRLDIVHLLLSNEVNNVETKGSGRWYYIEAVRLASKKGHVQVEKLLRNHREWTEEDWALWNHPRGLEYDDDSDGGSGSELEPAGDPICVPGSEDGEFETVPLQTVAPSAIVLQSDGMGYELNNPVDQHMDFNGNLQDFTFPADPFTGYQHIDDTLDAASTLEWDDLDFI